MLTLVPFKVFSYVHKLLHSDGPTVRNGSSLGRCVTLNRMAKLLACPVLLDASLLILTARLRPVSLFPVI